MPNISLVKKKPGQKAAMHASKAQGAVLDFQLQDNGDDTCTLFGVDTAGNRIDISTVATQAPPPASSDTTKLTVDTVAGMTFSMHAVGPLTDPGAPVQVTDGATWNDGSRGPFTVKLPVDLVTDPTGAVAVVIVPGVPTIH